MGTWITPKTDWKKGDAFQWTEYNRIKSNLEYLHELAQTLYKSFSISEMGEDKTPKDFYFADEINALSDNLARINDNIYPVVIGEKTEYYPNREFIGSIDLNRIESGCLKIYNLLSKQKENQWNLPFTIGNDLGKEF